MSGSEENIGGLFRIAGPAPVGDGVPARACSRPGGPGGWWSCDEAPPGIVPWGAFDVLSLAAALDTWDPRVVGGIAAEHPVITFENRGVDASTGSTPDTIGAMAKEVVTFIPALGPRPGRPPRLLHGRHDRPGDRAG